jgi:cytidylate kinase
MPRPRSIEQALEEQMRRWQLGRVETRAEPRRPVITISRQHGARGGEVAAAVARKMGLTFYDREILTRIAQEAHLSERAVTPLDERDDRTLLADWLAPLISEGHLSPYDYVCYLTRVVGAIARLGGAVILGRGAHLILKPDQALRVLVVAPLAMRVATVAEREGLDQGAARHRVAEVEQERKAYLTRCFHADLGDPSSFDVQVNTGVLGVEGALAVIGAASAARLEFLGRSQPTPAAV